jgi:hypothetical protein
MLAWSSGDQYVPNTAGGVVSGTQSTFKPSNEYLFTTSVLPKGVLFGKSMHVPFAKHKSTYACLISGFIVSLCLCSLFFIQVGVEAHIPL